jgi:hypothetical protein
MSGTTRETVSTSGSDETAAESVERRKKIKKTPITLIADHSKDKIDFSHYFAMFLWLGWPSFYFYFMLFSPLLWLYARNFLLVLVSILTISAFTSIDVRKQPEVHV